ncbi:MAG: hypothetical protein IPN76_22255 [Saprospiraceae bacterium]|nr:hypothetical protein [Saprospiraceae bacterium]
MKKIYCLTTFLLLPYIFLNAQTTEEEYLYVTYGYKEQLLKGLDDKKGYHWEPITDYKFTDEGGGLPFIGGGKDKMPGKFEFEGLFRAGDKAPCAIVAIYKEQENMEKRDGLFIPIPHPDSGQDVLNRAKEYFTKDVKFKPEIRTHYILALQKLSMHLAAKAAGP